MLEDGDKKDQCVENIQEIYAAAIEACFPLTCDEQYDVAYNKMMEYCLSEGRNPLVCEVEAKSYAKMIH